MDYGRKGDLRGGLPEGESWLTPEHFRIGASSLVNNLLVKIVEQETGERRSPGYFAGN